MMKNLLLLPFFFWANLVFAQEDALVPYLKEGKYGYMTSLSKKLVLPIRYDQAELFHGNLAYVEIDGEFGFIDKNGNEIIQIGTYVPIYETPPRFNDGLLAVVSGKKYGVINEKGEIVVPFKYDYIGKFSEGKAAVGLLQDSNDYNFHVESYKTHSIGWNINLKKQIPRGSEYNNQKYWWGENGKMRYGFINTTGRVIVPIYYGKVGDYSNGLALVVRNAFHGKGGYINHNGIIEIPAQYVEASDFQYEYAHTRRSHDNAGNYIASNQEFIKIRNSRNGIINKKGHLILPTIPKAFFVDQNKVGLILRSWDEKVCFSTYEGEMKIPFDEYIDGIANVEGPIAMLDANNVYHFFNPFNFNEIETPIQVDELKPISNDVMVFSKKNNEKYGVLSKDLSVIIDSKYDLIRPFEKGYAKALKSRNNKRVTTKFFYIDKEGFEYYYDKLN